MDFSVKTFLCNVIFYQILTLFQFLKMSYVHVREFLLIYVFVRKLDPPM